MTNKEERAYKNLLYVATLDIRILCESRSKPSLNPQVWRQQYLDSITAGSIADWLHNLALAVAEDRMDDFDTGQFWRSHKYHCLRDRRV